MVSMCITKKLKTFDLVITRMGQLGCLYWGWIVNCSSKPNVRKMSCILWAYCFMVLNSWEELFPPPLTKTKPPNFIVKNASLFIFVVSGGNSFHSWKFHSLTIYWELILNEWKLVPHPTSLDDFVVIPLLEKKTNIECFVDLK